MFEADPLALFSWPEMILRLGLAALLGLLLGLDREIRGHDAGLRTHALVSLSSAMIMVSSLMLHVQLGAGNSAPDPLRAIQGLSQAIGFIAAGIIFVRGGAVRNMTTAANIWMAAAIGIACGCGQYRIVIVGALLALVLVVVLKVLERYLPVEKNDESKGEARQADK